MGIFRKSKESLYNKGIELYKKQEYAKAYNQFVEAVKSGSDAAAFMLGLFSERGYAVEKDLEEAIHWYQRADEAGVAEAKESLERAMLLHYGNVGVGAMKLGQYELARACFEKVLQYGNVSVTYNYAQLLEAGLGGRKHEARANELYRMAALKGHVPSAEKLHTTVEKLKEEQLEQERHALQQEKRAQETRDTELLLDAASRRANGRILPQDTQKARELLGLLKMDELTYSQDDRYLDILRLIEVEERRNGRK